MPHTAETWLEHRISYGETDAMQVVYYANYLHLFERARNLLIREHGMSYKTVEERGIYLPVREAACRYRSPIRYDDLIHIHATISEWRRASLTFSYEIFNPDHTTLYATGQTEHACVSQNGRPTPIPPWLRDLFEK